MWFIFISARRFYARTAQSPPALRPGQAPDRSVVNRPIRRVGLAPTSSRTLRGLLRSDLFLVPESKHDPLKPRRGGMVASGVGRAAPMELERIVGSAVTNPFT